MKVALRAFRDERLSEEDELRWLWLAGRVARALADDGAWDELTARHLEAARRAGAFSALPVALTDRVLVELVSGRIGVAMSLAAEADAVVEATASHFAQRTSVTLANWRGRDAEALALSEARRQDVLRRGEGLWLAADDWGSRASLQRAWPLRRRPRRGRTGRRGPSRAGAVDLGAAGADRGCRAQRPGGARGRSARPTR